MALDMLPAGLSGAKYAIELIKRVNDSEIKSELLNALIDVQLKTTALQDENTKLKEEIKQLKDTQDIEKRMERKGPLIILDGIVYCGVCWGDGKKIPMGTIELHNTSYFRCVKCSLKMPVN